MSAAPTPDDLARGAFYGDLPLPPVGEDPAWRYSDDLDRDWWRERTRGMLRVLADDLDGAFRYLLGIHESTASSADHDAYHRIVALVAEARKGAP